MSADYTYDDYLQSGEVRNPMDVEPQPETNEYTNNDIRNSLDADDPQHNQDTGTDLNGDGYDNYNGYGY